ncbi:hypothetical protein DY023_06615 [Microbacterium bovistercoris]|uniref:Uncharacterized protein n=1 Tax=Microbacterium bovistercoris TaxID=2293570 RepID=A0A371NUW9_9MICO|nr:hypothetical protein [Microbacterium bovistercoris]REJ06298.1 hypothetical protein DY023_06615 [Microbacterium bovistercoris]
MNWELTISILALAVSVTTGWYALSARAVVHADVSRVFTMSKGAYIFDGDDVVVYNTGRSPAIILGIEAVFGNDDFGQPRQAIRGDERELIQFPEMPITLNAQTALRVCFPSSADLYNKGVDNGYRVEYLRPRIVGRARHRKLVVKAARHDTIAKDTESLTGIPYSLNGRGPGA